MAISFDEVRALKATYEDIYRPRHEAFRALRKYYHGDYWKLADYEQSRPITSIFRDLTAHLSDIGPEIKLVFNIIQMVVNKYQTFLSPLPQIRMWVDPPESDTRRAQAMKKQRYLYGLWEAGNMTKIFNNIAWYLPLMGDCYLGLHPDFDLSMAKPLLRSPEYAYPIPSFDKQGESAVVFAWRVHESVVAKNFVEYQAPVEQLRQSRQGRFRRGQAPDPHVEIMEYSDKFEFHRWITQLQSDRTNEVPVGVQEINGVVHNFGFNMFDHLKFIDVPDEPWGHGAVEQAINLNEMGNALYSLLFQAVIENVFPRLVLENPAAAPEEIESGPGAVIPLNAGGKAYWLQPEGPMVQGSAEFMRTNELNIRNATGMPGVNFGESPATSIVTGKAVNELQGAGTGSMIEMVQGCGIGEGIVSWNEKALIIGRRMFADDTIAVSGQHYANMLALAPTYFSLKVKGSELVGGTRNDVVFSPALSQHERLVMNLQGLGAGLWSKKYVREQQGLPDSDAMVEEIYAEQIDDAMLGFILSQFQQQPDPQQAADVEKEGFAILQGQTPSPPHPLTTMQPPTMAAGPGGPKIGPNPAGALPSGAGPQPAAAAPAPASGAPAAGTTTVNLDQARAAFEAVRGIQGQVYLVGEIVQQGQTNRQIEVMITNPADQAVLIRGLPEYQGRLLIHVITGKPQEQSVDVTPRVTVAAQ